MNKFQARGLWAASDRQLRRSSIAVKDETFWGTGNYDFEKNNNGGNNNCWCLQWVACNNWANLKFFTTGPTVNEICVLVKALVLE